MEYQDVINRLSGIIDELQAAEGKLRQSAAALPEGHAYGVFASLRAKDIARSIRAIDIGREELIQIQNKDAKREEKKRHALPRTD